MPSMFLTTSPLSDEAFDDRVAWAIHRGRPRWLWPDVAEIDWQAALAAIQRSASQILATGLASEKLEGDARAIGIAAYTSGMGPLLGYWIAQGVLHASAPIAEGFAEHYRQNVQRMAMLADRTLEVVERLAACGIPVTILKGMHTAYDGFPAPATRPAADIDLFVVARDKQATQTVLRQLGYAPEREFNCPDEQSWRHFESRETPASLDLTHADDPWGIDLHTSANRRHGQGSPIIRLDDLAARARPNGWPLHEHPSVMPREANILFLACHAGCGFTNLRMVRLVELSLVIKSAPPDPEFSWHRTMALGEQTGTLRYAYAALKLTADLDPAAVPDHVLQRTRRGVPSAVSSIVERLTPATAHAIDRCSVEERYMWTRSLAGLLRQAAHDLIPLDVPAPQRLATVERRMLRLLQGTLSMKAAQF